MKALWLLTRQRVFDVLRSKSSVGFVVAFPVVLLLVVGVIFMRGHPFEQSRVAVVITADDAVSELVLAELGRFDLQLVEAPSRREAEGMLDTRMANVVIETHGDQVLVTGSTRSQFVARGIAAQIEEGTGRKAVVELMVTSEWGYVHYLFAGLVAFSVMLSGLFATGWTMVAYRQNRFLKKLATTPLRKTTFVAALVAARGSLIYLQIGLMTLVGVLVFELRFGALALLWFALICALGLGAFMGLGFILACLIESEDLIVDIVSAVTMPFVLLSEIFFPLDALPRALEIAGSYLPSTEMVRMLRDVLLYGVTDPSRLAGGLTVLAIWTAATFAISLKVFKWHS